MMNVMRRPPLLRSLLAVAAGVLAGCSDPAPAPPPPPPPASRPVSRPATSPVVDAPKPLETYVDVLLADDPKFPTTQPLTLPLANDESARLVFNEPLLLDAVGRLWITHPRGQTPAQILAGDLKRQTYAVDRRVRFTWWKADYEGKPTVEMILDKPGGGLQWVYDLGGADVPAAPGGRDYVWDDAFVYGDSLVVPTVGGAAILTPKDRPDAEQYHRRYDRRDPAKRPDAGGRVELQHAVLADPRPDLPRTQIRLDGRGLIAWVPWQSKKRPGGTIARFVDGGWTPLTPPTWSDRPIHLMPLTDGNVLQLAGNADGGDATLSAVPLDAVPVDESRVSQLVDQLSDGDPRVREKAFAALADYGPGVWATLDILSRGQPAFIRRQIDVLLGDKTRPTLGGLAPEPGPVEVREELADGGVILNFRNGILLPDSAGVTVLERPALLTVRPGRRTRLLDPLLAADVEADPKTRVFVWGDEIIVSRPGESPKRWLFNHYEPLLDAKRAEWQQLVGTDQMGRWLFRKGDGRPAAELAAATQPTLVVDNRLPDPTPRLPVWSLPVGDKGIAGWDEQDWPVIKSGGVWRLKEDDWEPRPAGSAVLNDTIPQLLPGILPVLPKGPQGPQPLPVDESKPFAVGPDGAEYRGGVTEIRVRAKDGRETVWPLPPGAVGSGPARGVVDAKGRIFLFNRPGRVVRIDPAPDGSFGSFEVAATFEDPQIPAATPRRVWIDPAGRICALFFNDSVTVMWPDGRVPPSIREKIPSQQRYDAPGGRQGV